VLSPAYIDTIKKSSVLAFWQKSTEASQYFVQIAQDSLFAKILFTDSTIVDTTLTYQPPVIARDYYWRVCSENEAGHSPWTFGRFFFVGPGTGLAVADIILPTKFELNQNFPNPFNPATTLRYGLPMNSRVKLHIFNVLGQLVAELVNAEQCAGWYQATWNANVASGLYIYKLEAVSQNDPNHRFVEVKKMILMR
jgi:hypothetical protein